jgi:hypothetical protein
LRIALGKPRRATQALDTALRRAQIRAFSDFWQWDRAAEETYAEIVGTCPDKVATMVSALRQGQATRLPAVLLACGGQESHPNLRTSRGHPLVLVVKTTENRWADVPSGLDPLPITHRVGNHRLGIGAPYC